jgi:hypothetical protein
MNTTSLFPSTIDRVAKLTPDHVNKRVINRMEKNLSQNFSDRSQIEARLQELDREWDIDRAIETWASGAISLITLLGFSANRRIHALGWVVGGFLLTHALFGWCPPTMVFRRLGFRTAHEIESERFALKVLRGDFNRKPTKGRSERQGSSREISTAHAHEVLSMVGPELYH